MLIAIALIIVFVAAVLILAASKPDTFQVQRKAYIQAPPERVFTLINNFHLWGGWSPWEKYDPTMKRTYSGADSSVGAIYEWQGNKKVGSGRMEILESTSPAQIKIKLDFFAPFEAHNVTDFTFEAKDSNTNITWTMSGPNLFIGKLMQVFMSMDKMVGKDFEEGLANIKSMTEGPKANAHK